MTFLWLIVLLSHPHVRDYIVLKVELVPHDRWSKYCLFILKFLQLIIPDAYYPVKYGLFLVVVCCGVAR